MSKPYVVIKSHEMAKNIAWDLNRSPYPTALDTETYGIDPTSGDSSVGLGRILIASVYNPIWRRPRIVEATALFGLREWLESDRPKLFVNFNFDAHMFGNEGLKINGLHFDAAVADAIFDENRLGRHGLKPMALDYCGFEMVDLIKQESNTSFLLRHRKEEFYTYAGEDALMTFEVCQRLEKMLRGESWYKDKSLFDLLIGRITPFQIALWKMERRGVHMNLELLDEKLALMEDELINLEVKAYKRAGKHFNLNSPQQIGQILYVEQGATPTKFTNTQVCSKCGKDATKRTDYVCKEHGATYLRDKPSTSSEVLKTMKNPFAKIMTKYSKLKKLRDACKDYKKQTRSDGRLHTSFKIMGAVTGRLSSRSPNLQNVSSKDTIWNIRECFAAPEGYELVGVDYSQLEIRVAAHFSQEPVLVSAIMRGEDVHSAVTKKIFRLDYPVEEVKDRDPLKRKLGKNINFGTLYGMGPQRLVDMSGCTLKEAKKSLRDYFAELPVLDNYIRRVHRSCERWEQVKTLLGRRRRLPHVHSDKRSDYYRALRQALNSIIQGSASEIIQEAMLKIDQDPYIYGKMGAKMILQVHDELIFEVPEGNGKHVLAPIKKIMEHPFKKDLRVPLIADPVVGKTWLAAKD